MARCKCPSCGEPYNGKRCRSCLYEHFTEEIAHGNHTHEGEPLVIDAPVRRPIRRKDPFDCEKKTKKTGKKRWGLIVVLVVVLWSPILNFAVDLVTEITDRVSYGTAEPEPVLLPEDGMTLYTDEDLWILADWKNGQEYTDGIRIFVENNTGYDLTVTAEDIIVNGYMMDSAYLYCEAMDGTTSFATLRLGEDALNYAGITAVEDISFYLEAWEQETYDSIATSGRITLQAAQAETDTRILPEGQLLYDQDGVRISFLGYREDAYYPGEVCEGVLLFHIENNTDRYLQVYSPEAIFGDEEADASLWCQLYPGTRAVGIMYLYPLEEFGFASAEDLFPVQLALEITDRDDYSFLTSTGWLYLNGD